MSRPRSIKERAGLDRYDKQTGGDLRAKSAWARYIRSRAAEDVYETGPKQSFETTTTERVNFAPGGTIRLNNSYGYLTVEGWDEPAVEIVVIKSTDGFYPPSRQKQAEKSFAEVRVATERRSDKELAISMHFSGRHRFLPRAKHGVTVEYRMHVPRESRLVIHHDNGYVWVSDMTGDLEVRSHTGDMIVMLPEHRGHIRSMPEPDWAAFHRILQARAGAV